MPRSRRSSRTRNTICRPISACISGNHDDSAAEETPRRFSFCKAYHIALGGKPAAVLNGISGDQRFHVAYAQSWREIRAEGTTRAQLLSNSHSPAAYRVNGVVRNDNGWYAAFPQIKHGDRFYLPPDKRVPVW